MQGYRWQRLTGADHDDIEIVEHDGQGDVVGIILVSADRIGEFAAFVAGIAIACGQDVLCWWCKKRPPLEGDTLCLSCWGAKSAGLSREEALADDGDGS